MLNVNNLGINWSQVVAAVLIALLATGTSPWWFTPLRDRLFSKSSVHSWLRDGAEIELKIGGLWLDGATREAEVKLSPSAEHGYTGTKWRVHVVGDRNARIIKLKSLGHLDGGSRWLEASTTKGAVRLAEEPISESTEWKVKVFNQEDARDITLEAFGGINKGKWLEGKTNERTVRLAQSRRINSSNLWRVRSI